MARRRLAVRDLAREAKLDLDETLVLLWDARIEGVTEPAHLISARDLNRARRAVGIPTRRELTSLDYWQTILTLNDETFRQLCGDLGIPIRGGSSTLPKGAVAKLKAEARRRGIGISTEPQPPPPPTKGARTEHVAWKIIGHVREPLHMLSEEQVCSFHRALADDFREHEDPIEPAGLQSADLLGSAVARPKTCLGDDLKYPTVELAAAALLHSLVHNHAFVNGNKRTALVTVLVFLDENGLILTSPEDDLFRFVLIVAQHKLVPEGVGQADREVQAIAKWLCDNSRVLERGDRPIPMRRLRQILAGHGCQIDLTTGSRMNIRRHVHVKGFLGIRKFFGIGRTLKAQISYRGEGAEVPRNAVAKIRSVLRLDDENGLDSRAFYDEPPTTVSDFISRYRKTLRRLARM